MVTLYSAETHNVPKLRAALPDVHPKVIAEDWSVVEHAGPQSKCIVVSIEWLHTSQIIARLSEFKRRNPRRPVVLVTRLDPENARCLKDVLVEEVVWYREIERRLATVVERVCRSQPNAVECIAVALEETGSLPAPLRRALAHACRSKPPVTSVGRLARDTGMDRRTLWRQWTQAESLSATMRLEDFIHWLPLIRAIGRKVTGTSWRSVADELGIHQQSLGRWSRALAGRQLRELDGIAGLNTIAGFRKTVLTALLGGTSLERPEVV